MENPTRSTSQPLAATGNRSLAAIVFTDTVGFSSLAARDEVHALTLVNRDLERMKALCVAFDGQPVKSTGDGLLMLFNSAVQAVACSLEIQRDIHQNNLTITPQDQLKHRIGIHLGDVFINGNDVLGDGVNIAARLQNEALPGGICVSHTVYDVVNNRVKFHVNALGERKLKNIGKVKAYQISPLEGGYTSPGGPGSPKKTPWWMYGTICAGLFITACFVLGALHKKQASSTNPAPTPTHAPQYVSPHPTNPPPPPPQTGSQDTNPLETFQEIREYAKENDFDGMSNYLKAHPVPPERPLLSATRSNFIVAADKSQYLFTWAATQLNRYTIGNPISVTSPKKEIFTVYWDAGSNQMMISKNGQTPTRLPLKSMNQWLIAEVFNRMINDQTSDGADRIQLQDDLKAFRTFVYLDRGHSSSQSPSQ